MASKSVNITDFKTQLVGAESDDKLLYEFPVIKSVNKLGSSIQWQIVVGVLDAHDKPVKIVPEYYNGRQTLENKKAFYKVLSKHEKSAKYDEKTPTYITAGKNLGKKNQTNIFTQALRDALSEYNKYLKKNTVATSAVAVQDTQDKKDKQDKKDEQNGKQEIDDSSATETSNAIEKTPNKTESPNKTDSSSATESPISGKTLYPPMLAVPHDDIKIDFSKPTYIQRKFNGVRAVATYDKNLDKVILYSRGLGIYPESNINRELYDVLKSHPELYLDGEIYKHGVALQDISGIARGEKNPLKTRTAKSSDVSDYYIYDLFEIKLEKVDGKTVDDKLFDGKIVEKLTEDNFYDRYLKLKALLSPYVGLKHINLVDTYEVKNQEDIDRYYKQFLAEKYEGAIVRINLPYIFSYKGRHCANLLKFKQLMDNEFKVINIAEGTAGKAKGAILFEFETDTGKKFTVTPKGTLEYRKQLYKKLTGKMATGKSLFEEKFKDHKMRVHFEELSKDGVPLRARIEEIYLRPFDE